LGELVYAAAGKTQDGKGGEAMHLWKAFTEVAGLVGDDRLGEAKELAGKCMSGIVPGPGPGPLHLWINPMTDLLKFWPFLFESLHAHLSGGGLHKRIKAKEIGQLVGGLIAGWQLVRAKLLPKIIAMNDNNLTARFDLTAFLHLFETTLPLAHLTYSIFVRSNFKGDDATKARGEHVHLIAKAKLLLESLTRQRKNYPTGLLAEIDSELYWEHVKHPMGAYVREHANTNDEAFGEGVRSSCTHLIFSTLSKFT
jgi:hypothetical protein